MYYNIDWLKCTRQNTVRLFFDKVTLQYQH